MRFESFEMKYRYTTESLSNDVIHAYATESLPPKRGALITAAMKRYKSYIMLHFLYVIHNKEDLDITPTLAHRLIYGLFGRSISNRTLIDMYGRDSRHGSKSEDFERIDELLRRYKADARKTSRKMNETARNVVEAAQEIARNLEEQDPESES
jgi:hypothetical protein